jgi:hypothetical protein
MLLHCCLQEDGDTIYSFVMPSEAAWEQLAADAAAARVKLTDDDMQVR